MTEPHEMTETEHLRYTVRWGVEQAAQDERRGLYSWQQAPECSREENEDETC